MAPALARTTDRQGHIVNQYQDYGLIYCSKFGTALMHTNLNESVHGPMKRLKLADASMHECRHTAATNMLHAGVPLNQVSHILGHAGVDATAKIHAHAMP
jgi:site-specific recombinase XerD